MAANFETKVLKITKTAPQDKTGDRKQFDENAEPLKVDKNISKMIIKARSAKEMTQKDLATKASIPTKTLSDWENGKGIYKKTIAEKIEKVLGIKLMEDVKKK